jgi:hypothetical protein
MCENCADVGPLPAKEGGSGRANSRNYSTSIADRWSGCEIGFFAFWNPVSKAKQGVRARKVGSDFVRPGTA